MAEAVPSAPVARPPVARALTWGAVAAAWAGLAVPLVALLRDADRGVDLSDESHYLLAARPWASGSAFNGVFGWYLGPWLRLLGDDVPRLRVAAVLVLLAVALWTARALRVAAGLLARPGGGGDWPAWLRRLVPAGTAAAALGHYLLFIRTPGYGWFATTGLLLLTGGVLLLLADPPWRGPLAEAEVVLALGLGLGVTAVGKLTSALAGGLVVAAAAAVVLARGPRGPALRRLAGSAALVAVLAVGHLALVQDLGTTRRALERARVVTAAVDPEHYRTERVPQAVAAGTAELVSLGGSPLWLLALLPLVALLPRVPRGRASVAALASLPGLTVPLVLLAWAYAGDPAAVHLRQAAVPLVVAAQTGLVLAAVRLVRGGRDRTGGRDSTGGRAARPAAAVLLCCALALAGPVGTNNSYLIQVSGALVPLAAAAAVALWCGRGRGRAGAVAVLALVCVATTAVVVPAARERAPYRIAPLPAQTVPLDVVAGTPPLLVDPGTAAWAGELRRAAAAGGWRPGTRLLDLTWHPASVTVLDGRAPATLLPSFPRLPSRSAAVVAALSVEDRRPWRSAWMLVPTRRPAAAAAAARVLGRSFPRDYEQVGTATTPYDRMEAGLWRPRIP